MTRYRPHKFRKHLVSRDALIEEAESILNQLHPHLQRWMLGELSDAEIVGHYILIFTQLRYSQNWRGSKRAVKPPPYSSEVEEIFSRNLLRGIPESVNWTLLAWIEGKISLKLVRDVPSAYDMLEQQCLRRRYVTMITDIERLREYVIQERDPLGFVLHDLIHAAHFFKDPAVMRGQVGYYRKIRDSLCKKTFDNLVAKDEIFRKEFEYSIGDMNAHCTHHYKYLLGSIHRHFVRVQNEPAETEFKLNMFKIWNLPPSLSDSELDLFFQSASEDPN